MIRSRIAAAVVAIGTLSLLAPEIAAGGLTLVPGLDSWPALSALQRWGLVYVVLGGLVEWHLRRERRVGLLSVGLIACLAVFALFVAHLATVSGFDAAVEEFSWSVAVVIPFVAGTPRRVGHRYAALCLLAVPIAATRIAMEPVAFEYVISPLAEAAYLSLVGAIFGLPLFALGGVAGSRT